MAATFRGEFAGAALSAAVACACALSGRAAEAGAAVPDLSGELEFVCNPNALRWPNPEGGHVRARAVTSMYVRDGAAYVSGGEWNDNLGPCPIWSIDLATGTFRDEYDAGTERIDVFAEDRDGRLYAPYVDIKERHPEIGSFCVRETNGAWRAMKVWPKHQFPPGSFDNATMDSEGYAVHTWDLAVWKDRVFTAGYGIAWGEVGSDSVMSNATTSLATPHKTVSVVSNGVEVGTAGGYHYHRFMCFLPFEDDLFCLPQNYRCRYDPSAADMEVWRFDEATGQFVCDMVPWSEAAPGLDGQGGWFRPWHPVRLSGRTLYLMGAPSAAAPYPFVLCSAVAEGRRIKAVHVDLGGMRAQSVLVAGGRAYALAWERRDDDVLHAVWESSDGISFRRRFSFGFKRIMTAFALHGGCFYFCAGGRFPPMDAGVSGDIYRLRDPGGDGPRETRQ